MPYITTERVAEIRAEIKKAFPDFLFRCYRSTSHSTVHVVINAGTVDLAIEGKPYYAVNVYWYKDQFKDKPEAVAVFAKLIDIMANGQRTLVEDGDYGNVPTFYVDLEVGEYEKPYEFITAPAKKPGTETIAGNFEVVKYSERSVAVFGDTKPIKDTLARLGGKFNARLNRGENKAAGWIFSINKEEQLKKLLQVN